MNTPRAMYDRVSTAIDSLCAKQAAIQRTLDHPYCELTWAEQERLENYADRLFWHLINLQEWQEYWCAQDLQGDNRYPEPDDPTQEALEPLVIKMRQRLREYGFSIADRWSDQQIISHYGRFGMEMYVGGEYDDIPF